jgi:nitrite reductase/ring-hydroxylating ferredoxin subunit
VVLTDTDRRTSGDAPGEGVRPAPGGAWLVPKGRYLDEAWAARERAALWPAVWQLACPVTDVAHPGDWVEYRIADESYVVLRDLDGVLRAFRNACPHRGFKLCEGAGHAADGVIRCGFHGWCFDLAGPCRQVSSLHLFGRLDRADYALRPVRVDTWAGLVFVDPVGAGPSLAEFLDVVPDELAPFDLGARTCTYRCTIPMPGNWKVTVDAFNEAYHLQGLHPTLMPFMDDVHTTHRVFDRGHSMMQIPLGVASPRLGGVSEVDVATAFHQAYTTMIGELPADGPDLGGRSARDYAVARVRARCAAGGHDIGALADDQVLDDFHYLVFPNVVLNVHAEMHTVFRARPGVTPGSSLFDFWLYHRLADGRPHGPGDHVEFPEGARVTEVLDQDLDGIGRVQAGMRTSGIDHVTLGEAECRLVAMHRELDRLLGVAVDGLA